MQVTDLTQQQLSTWFIIRDQRVIEIIHHATRAEAEDKARAVVSQDRRGVLLAESVATLDQLPLEL